jgi:hypothetical protein
MNLLSARELPMYRLATSPDGSKTYYEFATFDGGELHALLTSSPGERASRTNLELFEVALKQIGN